MGGKERQQSVIKIDVDDGQIGQDVQVEANSAVRQVPANDGGEGDAEDGHHQEVAQEKEEKTFNDR